MPKVKASRRPARSNKIRKQTNQSRRDQLECSNYHFFYDKDSPLSNFHPAPFINEEGTHFFCSEQYMMYQKAILFDDCPAAGRILAEKSSPLSCKRLGRKVQNFNEKVWKAHARRIMEDGVYLKFSQNPSLRSSLLSTGDKEIVEAAPRDRIWGIGFSATRALEAPRSEWGSNWLGEVLMIVRGRIVAEIEQVNSEKGKQNDD